MGTCNSVTVYEAVFACMCVIATSIVRLKGARYFFQHTQKFLWAVLEPYRDHGQCVQFNSPPSIGLCFFSVSVQFMICGVLFCLGSLSLTLPLSLSDEEEGVFWRCLFTLPYTPMRCTLSKMNFFCCSRWGSRGTSRGGGGWAKFGGDSR